MSERKPPSQTTAGPAPSRTRTAMRRRSAPSPTVTCSSSVPSRIPFSRLARSRPERFAFRLRLPDRKASLRSYDNECLSAAACLRASSRRPAADERRTPPDDRLSRRRLAVGRRLRAPDHPRARCGRRRAHHRRHRRRPGRGRRPRAGGDRGRPVGRRAPGQGRHLPALPGGVEEPGSDGAQRRPPRAPVPARGRADHPCALAGAGLGGARRRAPAEIALRDDLSRQLFRPHRCEGALQLGHGARRRRHRQFPLHRRPDPPPACRAGRRPGAGDPSRHRPLRLHAPGGGVRPRRGPAPQPGASRRTSASFCWRRA